MTRGMMVAVLWRMAGRPDTNEYENSFTDVQGGRWYYDAVRWAAANGIVSGFGDGTFRPSYNITREQMAAMLFRYARFMNFEMPRIRTGSFYDDIYVSRWARASVNAMFEAGVISGRPGNVFDPQGEATRAEVAALLKNFLNIMLE